MGHQRCVPTAYRDTDRSFEGLYFSPFLKIGATLACHQFSGTRPDSMDLLKINVSGGAICSENSNNNLGRPTIPSGLAALSF